MTQSVAIVTGGTRGIGRAISAALKAAGHTVVAVYQGNEEAAKSCAGELGIEVCKCDVTDFDACQALATGIESEAGPVRVLVNNAGITRDGTLHKMSEENWHAVISTNLNSCFNMCRAVVPAMRERAYGRIVNISSINGQKGQFGQANYAAAKAGMLGFTRALALEGAGKGITANAVCPGYIETEMTGAMKPEVLESIIRQVPAGRLGKPGEIADVVAFLASERAAFLTGGTIAVNGGQYMS